MAYIDYKISKITTIGGYTYVTANFYSGDIIDDVYVRDSKFDTESYVLDGVVSISDINSFLKAELHDRTVTESIPAISDQALDEADVETERAKVTVIS